VSDLYCPVNGEVVDVNAGLDDDPSLVNTDPYGAGWMIRLKVTNEDDVKELLDADAYETHLGG
jgi:glycine cleavage system H protein